MKKLIMRNFASVFLPFALVALAACSAKVDGGSGGAPIVPTDPFAGQQKIAGPNVEGAWTSDCVAYLNGSRILSLTFTSNHFERVQNTFTDTSCQKSQDTTDLKGQFIFSKVNADGSDEINYAIDLGSGVTQFTEEKLLEGTNVIYVSDFQIGDLATVDRDMPLIKAGTGVNPTPVAPPTPIVTAPGNCVDYSGTYMMNTDYFQITQTACQQILWADLPSFTNNNPQSVTYVVDGIARAVGSRTVKATFQNQLLNFEYKDSSNEDVVEVYSFQQQPCNLLNPDGQNYLTRETWVNGQKDDDACAFWSKQ